MTLPRKILWWASLAVVFAGCAVLGSQHSIGSHPLRSAGIHLTLMACLVPLIRWFPFQRRGALAVFVVAVLARALVLPMHHSDDVHRYVWEGRVLRAGLNPYELAPESEDLSFLRGPHWEAINKKHMTAIYPPGALLTFRTLAGWTEDPVRFKQVMSAVDGLAVALLLWLLHAVGRRPAWALLYAINPVILLSFAGEGHMDVLLVVLMLLAAGCHLTGRHRSALLVLGLAVHAKYIAVLLLPFFLRRSNVKHAWLFLMALAIPAIPFLPGHGLLTSLSTFSTDMHYNGSIQRVLGWALDDNPLASTLCAAGLLAWLAAVRMMTPRVLEGAALVTSGLLLLSPNVHFWYLAWAIPFLCFYPFPAMMVLCASVALTFHNLGQYFQTSVWIENPWVTVAEYLPVYVALAWGTIRNRVPRAMADARPRPPVKRVSFVVPVVNEADILPRWLEHLSDLGIPLSDVIVSDGGSTDGTPDMAARAGCRVVSSPLGRGRQIKAGVDAADGDVVCVAHVDMTLYPGLPERVCAALETSGADGGCAGCKFDSRHIFLKGISCLNMIRARWFGVSFGDQAQFFRRDALEELGGFPDLPIMEDVELSMRMKQRTRPVYLGRGVTVSARRWQLTGNVRNAVLILQLVAAFGWRRWRYGPGCNVTDLYEIYYGRRAR